MSAQFAERLLARADRDERQRAGELLRDIEGGAQRMVSLIDDLLDVAHLRAGRSLQLNLAPTRLLQVVEQAIERHRLDSDRHTVRLVAAAEPVGAWDPVRLGRVLDNLLSNAVKYSPGGGTIKVTVGTEGERWAVLRVADHGVGIPPSDVPYVFDRFRRGRNVSGRIAGTGIGLAAVRRIVEQHGGTVAVESEEGRGTVFTVRLPRPAP
jgi:signal transduction histidine kinase